MAAAAAANAAFFEAVDVTANTAAAATAAFPMRIINALTEGFQITTSQADGNDGSTGGDGGTGGNAGNGGNAVGTSVAGNGGTMSVTLNSAEPYHT